MKVTLLIPTLNEVNGMKAIMPKIKKTPKNIALFITPPPSKKPKY